MKEAQETDGQLYIRYVKASDEAAFVSLYEKYRDGVIIFLYGMLKNMDDAEELMMDTFAVLASKTARYKERSDSSFKTWLYAIARNQARMFLRKNKHSFISLDEEDAPEPVDPHIAIDEELIDDEEKARLYSALQSIEPDYRQVLYLMYFEDMKPAEISAVMKKNVKQVYNLIERGKRSLKKVLGDSMME